MPPVEVAGVTGLEPAASGVTGRRSNRLSYTPEPFAARLEIEDLAPTLEGVKEHPGDASIAEGLGRRLRDQHGDRERGENILDRDLLLVRAAGLGGRRPSGE